MQSANHSETYHSISVNQCNLTIKTTCGTSHSDLNCEVVLILKLTLVWSNTVQEFLGLGNSGLITEAFQYLGCSITEVVVCA